VSLWIASWKRKRSIGATSRDIRYGRESIKGPGWGPCATKLQKREGKRYGWYKGMQKKWGKGLNMNWERKKNKKSQKIAIGLGKFEAG